MRKYIYIALILIIVLILCILRFLVIALTVFWIALFKGIDSTLMAFDSTLNNLIALYFSFLFFIQCYLSVLCKNIKRIDKENRINKLIFLQCYPEKSKKRDSTVSNELNNNKLRTNSAIKFKKWPKLFVCV